MYIYKRTTAAVVTRTDDASRERERCSGGFCEISTVTVVAVTYIKHVYTIIIYKRGFASCSCLPKAFVLSRFHAPPCQKTAGRHAVV